MNEENLMDLATRGLYSTTDLFSAINQLPTTITDPEYLFEVVQSFEYSITVHYIQELRKKYQVETFISKIFLILGYVNSRHWVVLYS